MRNKNIDFIRGVALIWVMIYHIWILTGSPDINNGVVYTIIKLGGEIGVTLFFIISGFGIYYSIVNMEKNNSLKYLSFLKKRLVRIIPEYYLCMFIVLFFTAGAGYLSKEGILDIFSHMIFFHNITPLYAGSINGVLWTMAVTFQFYLLAIPMYRLLRKIKGLLPIIAIAITVLFKLFMFKYLGYSGSFWASRQMLFSVIDNFAIGMFIAYMFDNHWLEDWFNNKVFNFIATILSCVFLFFVCQLGLNKGIHVANLSGITWHTLVALISGLIIFFYSRNNIFTNWVGKKFVLWVADNEYGTYITHLLVIQYVFAYSTLVQKFVSMGYGIRYLVFLIICLFVGYVYTLISNGLRKELIIKQK